MESSKITHSIGDIQQQIKVDIISSRYNDEVVAMLKNSCIANLYKIDDNLFIKDWPQQVFLRLL